MCFSEAVLATSPGYESFSTTGLELPALDSWTAPNTEGMFERKAACRVKYLS